MDEQGFKEFCHKLSLNEETIQAQIEMARTFHDFLRKKGKRDLIGATTDDLQCFVAKSIENGTNTWDNLLALLRYSRFAKNRDMEVALLELLDGSDVLETLSETLRQTVGEEKRSELLKGINLPPLGTHPKDRPKVIKAFMERLEGKLGEKMSRKILLSGPHAASREEFLSEREKFQASNGIDDFLDKRHIEYIEELEKHKTEKTLYFTQEIDENVLEYVRKTPTCQNGVREGDVVYVTKIPYMAQKYLQETNPKMKRYYYCHCPWVREAIISGVEISPNFCYCSAAFEKRPWDVIFDQAVEVDVVQSVLKGDLVCRFAIHIPKRFLESKGDSSEAY